MSLMVSVAASKFDKSSIFFVEPGAKVNGAYYREKLLASMIPEMDRLTGYQPYADLNPVDYCVWSALERNVYRGRRFENTIELKEAILQMWEALPQAVISNAIDGFRSRVRLVIAENGNHIEKY